MVLNYQETKKFWDARAKKYGELKLESITLLEDFPELIEYKDNAEKQHLLRLMSLQPHWTVLDMGCGIGRWSFVFAKRCKKVVAVDYSGELLKIAQAEAKSRMLKNIEFIESSALDFSYPEQFDLILVAGVLLYINDEDIENVVKNSGRLLKPHGILVSREPTGVNGRVERINRYEKSLDATYNAIYRSVEEFADLFARCGFKLTHTNFVYPPFSAPLSIYNHLVPQNLKNTSLIKSLLGLGFSLNLIFDPFLLKFKSIYEFLSLRKRIEIAQRLYVYRKTV